MDIVNDFIGNYISYIIIALVVINFIMLMITIINSIRLGKLKHKYEILSNGIESKSLEKIINEYYEQVEKVIKRIMILKTR